MQKDDPLVDGDALVVWLLVSGDLILLGWIAVLVLADGETIIRIQCSVWKTV